MRLWKRIFWQSLLIVVIQLPHMRVFWEQQRKMLAQKKFGRRYHPHIIRICLSIHAKSPAAYEELRDSGILVLPSEKTLRDYRNFFTPRAGFDPSNVERLMLTLIYYSTCIMSNYNWAYMKFQLDQHVTYKMARS